MITYGSTTLTSYNSIVKTEVYYYKSTSATSLSGGSWSTTKPTWENGKYIWQKIRTVYEDGTHTESDPVNITGQQGATGTAAYSYKLNSSDSIIGKTKDGEYTIKKITFSATYKQGTGAVSAYSGRFKIESTTNGSTWKTEYTSSGNETSKEFTIPDDIIAIRCLLYQSDGTTVLLDIVTVPVVKDGVDAIGLRDSIPYYLASDKDTGITRLTQGWTRYRPQLTAEKKYLWVYYVSRYSEGTTEPELIEIKDDVVHFVNNGDESPVKSCVVDIEPVQAGSGDPSPTNVRPITGWTGAKVTRTGKNLCNQPIGRWIWSSAGQRFDNIDGTYCATEDKVPVKGGEPYVVSFTDLGRNSATYFIWFNEDGFIKADIKWGAPWTATAPQNATKVALTFSNNERYTGEPKISNVQLELGSTATEYEPYQGDTYDITFPTEAGTVYGGTLDVTKGELVVDRAMVTLDGSENWYWSPNNNLAMINIQNGIVTDAQTQFNIYTLNSTFVDESWARRLKKDGTLGMFYGTSQLYVKFSEITGADVAKAFFADNPTTVVYKIATSTTYHLTPQEITMLCNENNIFADTGQTAISYYDNQTSTDPYVDYSLTSAFDAAVDAIEVGGRNILLNSAINETNLSKIRATSSFSFVTEDGIECYKTTGNNTAHLFNNIGAWDCLSEKLKANTTYTYSAWIKTNVTHDFGFSAFGHFNVSNSASTKSDKTHEDIIDKRIYKPETITENQWTKISITFTTNDLDESTFGVYPVYNTGTDTVLYIYGMKLEKGTKPTDWTPAPEDVDASIATAQTTADTAMDRATAIYGTCSTDSTVDAKVVICPDFVLFDGARIQVTFTNANTASAPTLNVNSTGAKAIYINKTVTSSSNLLLWTAGSKMEFVYDGTGWIAQNIPYALYGTCSTGASTAAKTATCNEAVICKGTSISINMTNTNTAANATLNVGSTVAKDIYANDAKLTVNSRFNWRANTVQKFVFDGQVWRMDDDSVKALATAYITEIDDDGIMVHPEDDSNSGWAISDAIQLFKNGISYIKLWIENNIPKIRIGKEDQGHIILDNDSVDIGNDNKILASFGETSIIGNPSEATHTEISKGGFRMYINDIQVLNLRTTNILEHGYARQHTFFTAVSSRTSFGLSFHLAQLISVYYTDNQEELPTPTISEDGYQAIFPTSPQINRQFVIVYYTDEVSYDITLGTRSSDLGYYPGTYSACIGRANIARYQYSTAIGHGIQALRTEQTILGRWNNPDHDGDTIKYNFLIGNGTSNINRLNAFGITDDNNIHIALDTTASSGTTDAELYDAIKALGWEDDVIK